MENEQNFEWRRKILLGGILLVLLLLVGLAGQIFSLPMSSQSMLAGLTKGEDEMRDSPPYLPGWPVILGPAMALFSAAPLIKDIDGGGYNEVVAAIDIGLYVWDYLGNLKPGWPYVGAFGFIPALADINQDGDFELFINDIQHQFGLDYTGQLVSGWPVTVPSGQFDGSSAIGDLDKNGDWEILTAHLNPSKLYVWNSDGTSFPGWPVSTDSNIRNIALADLDGGSGSEIIAVNGHYIYIWRRLGTNFSAAWPKEPQPWAEQIPGCPGTYYNNPINVAVGDIDKDSNPEIVTSTYNYAYQQNCKRIWIHVYKTDGSELNGFPVSMDELYGESRFNITLANLDTDPQIEIIVTTTTRMIVVQPDGSYSLWGGQLAQTPGFGMKGAVVGDIDGNNVMEILTPVYHDPDNMPNGNEYGEIYAWHPDGSIAAGFPIVIPFALSTMLTMGDVNKDGKIDIAGGFVKYGPYGQQTETGIYALGLSGPYNPQKIEWGTFAHDERHTNCYDCPPVSAPVPYPVPLP